MYTGGTPTKFVKKITPYYMYVLKMYVYANILMVGRYFPCKGHGVFRGSARKVQPRRVSE